MATESAVTENLIQYAIKAWAAGNDVHVFAGNELRTMIQNFLNTSRGKGNELDVDLGSLPALLRSIDERLAGTALDARDRDAWVRQIAELFRKAGTEGKMQGPIAPGAERPIIHTVDSEALRGFQMAQGFTGNGQIFLDANGHLVDPAARLKSLDTVEAIAAFVNALTPDQLRRLIEMPAGAGAIAKALATGALTPTVAKNLTELLFNPDVSRDARLATIRAIGNDPAAAAGLVRLLQQDPDLFSRFLTGEGWNGDHIPHQVPREQWGLFSQEFLKILTAAAPKLSKEELQRVVALLGEKLPDSPTWEVVTKLEPALTKFLVTAAPVLLGPPDGATPKELKDWVDRFGKNLDLLLLNDWLDKIATNEKDGQQKRNVLLENIFLGMLGAIPLLKVPSAVANVLLSGGWGGLAGVKLQPWLDSLINYPGEFDLQRSLRVVGFVSLLAKLAQDGQIKVGNDKPNFEAIQNDPGFKKALEAFANGTWKDDPNAQAWTEKLQLGQIDLEFLIDTLNSRFPAKPTE